MVSNITINILQQLKRHISQLTDSEYASKLEIFNGSSIGGHSRHIIEFYDCLIESIETSRVNYDARIRDHEIEKNRDYALSIINKLIQRWETLNDFDKNIVLSSKFGPCELATNTTFLREATYLIEHSIHHFALMRIGIQTCFKAVNVENDFGVAYSTLEYQSHNAKTCK